MTPERRAELFSKSSFDRQKIEAGTQIIAVISYIMRGKLLTSQERAEFLSQYIQIAVLLLTGTLTTARDLIMGNIFTVLTPEEVSDVVELLNEKISRFDPEDEIV